MLQRDELLTRVVRGFAKKKVEEAAASLQHIVRWRREAGADGALLTSVLPGHAVFHEAWPALLGGTDVWGCARGIDTSALWPVCVWRPRVHTLIEAPRAAPPAGTPCGWSRSRAWTCR